MIPPLAGQSAYTAAARVGPGVEATVRRLLRLHWVERRLMSILIARIPSTPEWEIKCALALHQWYCAQHADALRTRIAEMRHPVPPLDVAPDDALGEFMEQVNANDTSAELVTAVYGVVFPALERAYRDHAATTNPIADHPTRHLARHALLDLDDVRDWGERTLAAMTEVSAYREHLDTVLAAAGGLLGEEPRGETPRLRPHALASLEPRRDSRFEGVYNFEFPPHDVYADRDVPADERNLALLCKRTLEMDVPEMMASFMTERSDQPWEFYLDYSRQLWDEARHAMIGTIALTARGVDWTSLPLNVGFSLRLNAHATPQERQIMLFGIEQSLMPADVGKRFEYETARAADDELSAYFHDFDWADEVLHAQIGRRALKREGVSSGQAVRQAKEIHERTWAELEHYRSADPQDAGWWDRLVRQVLGRPSAWKRKPAGEPPKVLTE